MKYTLTIPLLTYKEALEIADNAFGSMYWNTTSDGTKQAWPYNDDNPVEIKPEDISPRSLNPIEA